MKAITILKASLFRVFFLLVLGLCITSCRKINPIESSLKNQAFAITEREETEALFFISTANATKSIISKSEIAQEKSSDAIVQELGKRIEFQENQILNDISKMATMKLIVINEINTTHQKRDLYNLIDANGKDFNDVYLDAMKDALNDQIELFETISRETNDKQILEMVLRYLPEQYKLLRETERLRKQNV